MELLRILIATVVVLGLFLGIRLLVEHLVANPSILRLSHHRRNTFMKKWRNQIIEHLLRYKSRDINTKITQAFPDAEISIDTDTDWTIIHAEHKSIPFTILHNTNGYFWLLQLPPIISFSNSLSFDQQREITMRIAEDFAPIRINTRKELGATHLYLIGEYLSGVEIWEEDEDGLSLLMGKSVEDFKNDLSKYVPEEAICVTQIPGEEELFDIYIPIEYKRGLINAQNSYLTCPTKFITPFEFSADIPNQPFTSQDGLIISPSIDIVKAWIDLYLFMKDELK